MLIFALRRFGSSLVLIFLVLTATFFLIHIAPGDPLALFDDPRIPESHRQRMIEFYGLDKPLTTQYAIWLGNALQGNWGVSINENRPAMQVLLDRFPNTVKLVAAALFIEYFVGLMFGLLAAARSQKSFDTWIRIIALCLYSVPSFWLALLGIEFLAVRWSLFPIDQLGSLDAKTWPLWRQFLDLLYHLAMPALVLGLSRFGGVMRFVRSGVLEVMNQDYIRTARAMGLSEWRILARHALPNALAPLIYRLSVNLPAMLSGAVVIEVIFSIPGLGQASYQAILARDYPVILANTVLIGIFVVAASFLAELAHGWLDPRARRG